MNIEYLLIYKLIEIYVRSIYIDNNSIFPRI